MAFLRAVLGLVCLHRAVHRRPLQIHWDLPIQPGPSRFPPVHAGEPALPHGAGWPPLDHAAARCR